MDKYIGTKIVRAEPLSKQDFQAQSGPAVKLPNQEPIPGYLVVYEDGYRSWSPKEVFERCYRKVTESELKLLEK